MSFNPQDWSIAEGEENGKPLYIRFRDAFSDKKADPTFPRVIQIVWKYQADEQGLPTEAEIPQLKAFESRLVEATEPNKVAVLVCVCTNNGAREWMFYASGDTAFEDCLNTISEDQEPFPIDITSAPDPKWTAFFDEILGAVG